MNKSSENNHKIHTTIVWNSYINTLSIIDLATHRYVQNNMKTQDNMRIHGYKPEKCRKYKPKKCRK